MADYRNMAFQVALEFGLDPDLFDRLIEQESGFNPKALSSAGAMGLTQLMPGTAKDRGVTDPWDPMQNLRGGAGYLKEQLDTFGTPELALAAYNAGPRRVREAGGVPQIKETQDYVRKILKGYSPAPAQARAVTPMQIPQAQMPMPTDMQMMPAAAQTAQAMSPWEDPMFWLSLAGGINPSADNPFAGIAPNLAMYNKARFEQKMDQQEFQQQQIQQQRIQQAREIAAQSIADPRRAALMRLGALDIQKELAPAPVADLGQVNQLRAQYQSNPSVRAFNDSSLAFSRMSETLKNKENPFASVAAVVQFMKSLDPGSTVTESESKQVVGATGWEEQIASIMNNATGKGRLTEEAQRDILRISLSQLEGAAGGAQNIWDNYARLARDQYRVDPSRVVFDRPEVPDMPKWAQKKKRKIPGERPAGEPPIAPVTDSDVDDVLNRVEAMRPPFEDLYGAGVAP